MPTNKTYFDNNNINNFALSMGNKKTRPKDINLNWTNTSSCFKGRSTTLTKIHKLFETHKTIVIHGAPGIGKTETVRNYGIKYKDNYRGNLISISAENEKNTEGCFKKLAKKLKSSNDPSQIYAKFTKTPCLIVFDNVVNIKSIKAFLPSRDLFPTISIIITSQLSQWDATFHNEYLGPLDLSDALDIFKYKLQETFAEYPLETWEGLISKLEGIPLSLQVVSSLLRVQFHPDNVEIVKFDLKKYVNNLDEVYLYSDILEDELNYYGKTVYSSIYSAIIRLKKDESKCALQTLCWISYLDADYIFHEDLLCIQTKEQLQSALTILSKYSLIQFQKDDLKVNVHRTIQLIVRKYDLNDQDGRTFKAVLKKIITKEYKTLIEHTSSLFKYVNTKDFEEKSEQFYHENPNLRDAYACFLARYHCDCILQLCLPKIKNIQLINKMLFEAICNKNTDLKTIDLLIEHGAKIENNLGENKTNAFLEATTWLSNELFECLLKLNPGNDVINSTNGFGQTILHLLVGNINKNNVQETIKCVDFLILKWNANIYARDNDSYTLLHTACWNENINLEMIKYLVTTCKCINFENTQNKRNETPLQLLFKWKLNNSALLEIVMYFINECKIDITIRDDEGWNTLFSVCSLGTPQVIRFLIYARDNDCRNIINNRNISENVAFTQLIYNTRIEEHIKIELMKLFSDLNMDFTVINKEKKTLAEIAADRKLMKLSVVMSQGH